VPHELPAVAVQVGPDVTVIVNGGVIAALEISSTTLIVAVEDVGFVTVIVYVTTPLDHATEVAGVAVLVTDGQAGPAG
jgi:hypothetical protein